MAWLDLLQDHWWVLGLGVLISLGTLALLPFVIVALPPDYFLARRRRVMRWGRGNPLIRTGVLVLKNLGGALLLCLGILLLVLPGQGLLTIVCGLVLLDFPGKYRCIRWLAGHDDVLKAMNWLRHKRGVAPLSKP